MRTITRLSKGQMKAEGKLRVACKIKRVDFEKNDRMVSFYDDDMIDGESFEDPDKKGWHRITVSLSGEKKYVSVFDTGAVGFRFYLTDQEAETLRRTGFLHIVEQYKPGPDFYAAETSEEKSKKPVLLN